MTTPDTPQATPMDRRRCIHGQTFPCRQCTANRLHNERSNGRPLTEAEFEEQYCGSPEAPRTFKSADGTERCRGCHLHLDACTRGWTPPWTGRLS